MPVNLKQLNCPNCGAPLNWDGRYDKPITCPYCGSQFMPGPTEVDDERYLKYSDLFVERFMDLRVDIPLEQALDLGWKTMAECFSPEEVGIKKADLDKHWPKKD